MVKRYDFNGYDFSKDEEVDGDYVSYEDYEKLYEEKYRLGIIHDSQVAQLKKLKEDVQEVKKELLNETHRRVSLEEENYELKREIDRLKYYISDEPNRARTMLE